ncbi:AAA family ATPase [bacterium]|nr:AAA family ATPase [bacterium]MBO7044528.1 AAA family ATPase [bacterium]
MIKNQDYSVLYQKYRPTKFSEVIGQEQFVKMLMNAIKNKQIANAYIFSGSYGIGKTTLARIFAKAVNCLNSKDGDACNECKNCLNIINNQSLDIIEIDAASNNGVENVRNIIENANYLPSSLNYKIYIIDEAHMITTGG